MTTRVTIDPANHRIETSLREGVPDDSIVTTVTLEPGSAVHEVWLYGNRVLTVREVPANVEQTQ